MQKQIKITVTHEILYTPNPENYPEGYTLEQMAECDANTDDIFLLIDDEDVTVSTKWDIVETTDPQGVELREY